MRERAADVIQAATVLLWGTILIREGEPLEVLTVGVAVALGLTLLRTLEDAFLPSPPETYKNTRRPHIRRPHHDM